jgi:hypothetical protein
MRKFAVLATVTSAVVLAFAAVAYAVNTYSIDSVSVSPSKAGTLSSPKPVSYSLTFSAGESSGVRPSSVKTFGVGLGAGVVPNTKLFGGCGDTQAGANVQYASLSSACRKNVIGSGQVDVLIGSRADQNGKGPCRFAVHLINGVKKNHINIRLDTDDSKPSGSAEGCVVPQHLAVAADFKVTGKVAGAKGGKLSIYALTFTVPDAVVFPGGALNSAITHTRVTLDKKTVKVKVKVKGKTVKVTRGYLETVGCPKSPAGKRTSTVTFTDLTGATVSKDGLSTCKS